MSGAEMHYQSEHAIAGLAQDHSIGCKGCPLRFVPKRPWQTFHSAQCRTEYHQAHGQDGIVKSRRVLEAEDSITIRVPPGSNLRPGMKVKVVPE